MLPALSQDRRLRDLRLVRSQTSSATPRKLKVKVEKGQAAVKSEVRDHLTAMTATTISDLGTVVGLNG